MSAKKQPLLLNQVGDVRWVRKESRTHLLVLEGKNDLSLLLPPLRGQHKSVISDYIFIANYSWFTMKATVDLGSGRREYEFRLLLDLSKDDPECRVMEHVEGKLREMLFRDSCEQFERGLFLAEQLFKALRSCTGLGRYKKELSCSLIHLFDIFDVWTDAREKFLERSLGQLVAP